MLDQTWTYPRPGLAPNFADLDRPWPAYFRKKMTEMARVYTYLLYYPMGRMAYMCLFLC